MARISGIDLPRDKRIEIALTYIYGIGNTTATKICAETGVDPDIRVRDLSEDDTAKIREYVDKNCHVEEIFAVKSLLTLRDLSKLAAIVAFVTVKVFR